MTDYTSYSPNKKASNLTGKYQFSDEEQASEAALLVEKTSTVDSLSGFQKVSRRIERQALRIQLFNRINRIAAILLLPVIVFSIWYNLHNRPSIQTEITEQTVVCPVGIRTQLVLPDGSHVWLNSGTTIKYQLPFKSSTRNIALLGEAFFKVAKDQIPFIVNTSNASIKVHGTEFNVKAYSEEDEVEVVLKEGSIGFCNTLSEEENILVPNDLLTLNKADQSINIINKNIGKHIAWLQNRLVFDETPLEEMALTLKRWYGIDVEIKDKELLKYKFTTTFENEPLLQVIELLELSSPIKIDYIPSKVDKDSNVISKAKIIIHKKIMG